MHRRVHLDPLHESVQIPLHGFGAQVAPVVETGMAILAFLLALAIDARAWHRGGHQDDL